MFPQKPRDTRTFLQKYEDELAAYIKAGAAQLDSIESYEVMAYVVAAAKLETLTALVVGEAVFGAHASGFHMGSNSTYADAALTVRRVVKRTPKLDAVLDQFPPDFPTKPDQFEAFVASMLKAAYEAGLKAGRGANESAHSQSAMSATVTD